MQKVVNVVFKKKPECFPSNTCYKQIKHSFFQTTCITWSKIYHLRVRVFNNVSLVQAETHLQKPVHREPVTSYHCALQRRETSLAISPASRSSCILFPSLCPLSSLPRFIFLGYVRAVSLRHMLSFPRVMSIRFYSCKEYGLSEKSYFSKNLESMKLLRLR